MTMNSENHLNHNLWNTLNRQLKNCLLIPAFVIISVLTLAILTINIRTNISQVEHDISLIQSDINEKTTQAEQLEQEKNELSKTERIQKIAEDNGLSIDDGNLRKVD